MSAALPRLVGVIHLAPLPGSPRYAGSVACVVEGAASDAAALAAAGFDAALVENYGDAPFAPERVEPATIAAMTACALAAGTSGLALGCNVLRNDAAAALAVALAAEARFIRINVHVGARVTDQGVVAGRAHETLRLRRALGAKGVALLCDVAVKHSSPLGTPRPLAEEARDAVERGLADAVLLTGSRTGAPVSAADLDALSGAVAAPVYLASGVGAGPESLALARRAYGVIVGSALRRSGRAGDPVDPDTARRFADAYRAAVAR
jgi:membrane complex biogenesis BtpA family protein